MSISDFDQTELEELYSPFTLGQDALIYKLRKSSHSWGFIAHKLYSHYKIIVAEEEISSRYEIVKGRTLYINLNGAISKSWPKSRMIQLSSKKSGRILSTYQFTDSSDESSQEEDIEEDDDDDSDEDDGEDDTLPSSSEQEEPDHIPRLILTATHEPYDESDNCAIESDSDLSLSDL